MYLHAVLGTNYQYIMAGLHRPKSHFILLTELLLPTGCKMKHDCGKKAEGITQTGWYPASYFKSLYHTWLQNLG